MITEVYYGGEYKGSIDWNSDEVKDYKLRCLMERYIPDDVTAVSFDEEDNMVAMAVHTEGFGLEAYVGKTYLDMFKKSGYLETMLELSDSELEDYYGFDEDDFALIKEVKEKL